jgi:YkoY family integral membrane protein
VKLAGAAYLLWLPYQHFFRRGTAEERRSIPPATPWLGLSAFWATVVRVELTDIVFAVDSILVAVAMSPKIWVILTGGILGIIAMRLVIGQLLVIVRRYPPLVDGAFIIIAWVGLKLLIEYLHAIGLIGFEVPRWLSLGLIVVIFVIAFLYARRRGAVPDEETTSDEATALLAEELEDVDK